MPLISIITTTYKHERFIRETIESILSQNFGDWELLIGDDSPDDATWETIQGYVEKYPEKIKAWHHNPNKWLVENMNFLISQVDKKSHYIAFLEGDDIYTMDCLQKKMDIFHQYKDVALVYSDMDFIDAMGNTTKKEHLQRQNTTFYQNKKIPTKEYILSKNSLIISYSTVVIRKNILQEFLPIQNLSWSKTYSVSDYDLFFHISKDHYVYGIPESLTQYRRHETNLSSGYTKLFDDLGNLIKHYASSDLIDGPTFHKKESWIHILKSLWYLNTQDKKWAWQEFCLSCTSHFTYAPFYKIALFAMIISPVFLSTYILKKLTHR